MGNRKKRRGAYRNRAKLFVISAPSGSGKTTLCNRLLGEGVVPARSVSTTTRLPRPGEKDGSDYSFVSEAHFRRMIKAKSFLEYEDNFGYLYGTPRKLIRDSLKKGVSIVLSIDVKGAMKVRKAYPKKSILIFILPPSINALKRRLRRRMSDDHRTILRRLKLARKEMSYKKIYDYSIVNDRLDTAYRKLKKIITAESGRA